ncbi:MAG: GTP cyclohydrolase I FolE [Alicyclobacillus sp.]|nr:GTP cyclohydrolase I FolE [Alicyclobacillus sp.]
MRKDVIWQDLSVSVNESASSGDTRGLPPAADEPGLALLDERDEPDGRDERERKARQADEVTLRGGERGEDERDRKREAVAYHVRQILQLCGEDIHREGLRDTPQRVARMMEELLAGMSVNPDEVLSTVFEEPAEGPVLVAGIQFYSLCEHHLVPFFGTAHVAYLPTDRVVGISKIARLVDALSRRLQVQERMTEQVVEAIDRVLRPAGVVALVEAEHTCMCARGVRKPGSKTVTLAARGEYRHNHALRSEFLQLIRNA